VLPVLPYGEYFTQSEEIPETELAAETSINMAGNTIYVWFEDITVTHFAKRKIIYDNNYSVYTLPNYADHFDCNSYTPCRYKWRYLLFWNK
jgi:hypothetical protein